MPRLLESTRRLRRRGFVDAAWACIASKPYGDVTVDDICAEAEFSKGAFYAHFESKQELLLALIDDDANAVARLAAELDRAADSPIRKLSKFARGAITRASEAGRVQLRADAWAAISSEPSVSARLDSAVQDVRLVLRAWIEQAVEAGEMVEIPANAFASILLALTDGLMLHHALEASAFEWRNIQTALDVLLASITPR
ncbi:MAG: TetR/AcrR family transcriptional regulator [Candidatus Dormiibacterota bacterium]